MLQAAERGNAKAMHNLAVLDADGGGKGANYKSASQWFRKAADRGVADSQFNLGILYARGIGVEQNLAESFKWFSLAAAQGDADSGRKRDDIAKRLDAQSLAAARLAIQTFTPEPQPDDAVNVASPAGGWDSAHRRRPTAAKPARQAGCAIQAHRRRALRPFTQGRDAAVTWTVAFAAISSATKPYNASARASNGSARKRTDCRPKTARAEKIASAGRRQALRSRRRACRPAQPPPPPPVQAPRAQAAFLVGRHLHPAGFRRRHSRLPGPVATRGLGLLEGPVRLAEPDIPGDRHARSRWLEPGPARAVRQRDDRPRRRELVSRAGWTKPISPPATSSCCPRPAAI